MMRIKRTDLDYVEQVFAGFVDIIGAGGTHVKRVGGDRSRTTVCDSDVSHLLVLAVEVHSRLFY